MASPVAVPEKLSSRPIKAACLSCRAAKTRCDGEHPCRRCSSKNMTCSFRPSRRGGVRRGVKRPSQSPASLSVHGTQEQSMSIAENLSQNHSLERIIDLLGPVDSVRNLDVYSGGTAPRHAESPGLRLYASEEDILTAYYVYIHSFLPVLSAPVGAQYHDRPIRANIQGPGDTLDRLSLPYWPKSSLTLAISAILSLIPLAQDPHAFSTHSVESRRRHAHLYAESAFSQIDDDIDGLSMPTASVRPSAVPEDAGCVLASRLNPILTLVMLSVYEYCQRGNISRMRSRANQAVTSAMDLSLHKLGPISTEAQRRAWWGAMLVLYLSSIDQQVSPIISLDDPRISTPFPSFQCCSVEAWSLLLDAEQSIISVSEAFDQCLANPPANALLSDLSANIMQLDLQIKGLAQRLDRLPQTSPKAGADATAARSMWMIARLLIHSARIRLHRARAFIDLPLFLDQYCDLAAIQDKIEATSAFDSRRPSNLDSIFPFTEQESSLLCLKSALVIAHTLEILPTANPYLDRFSPRKTNVLEPPYMLPFFMCAAMQGSYVLLMLHYRLRAALESDHLSLYSYLLHAPEKGSGVQDAERLTRELRQGIESIIGAVKLAQMFEGVGSMSQEIQIAYQSTLSGE